MNVFERLEAACAGAVERAFATAFPSALEPVQVARKLVAAFEAAPAAGRGGRRFIVHLSDADAARLEPDREYLERQWSAMLARLAERSGRPQRDPDVRTVHDAAVAGGTVTVTVEAMEAPAHLVVRVRRGLPQGARVPLAGRVLIGRDDTCDLRLTDPRVSRRHLEITMQGATMRASDLASSNGTLLNGVPLREADVGLGDVLTLGDSELLVEADDA